ncbi:YbaN family protein [Anaerotignum propionicum]|uniref:Inner membrane protein YbaN n=1 Tax=Anaerotignum propionicum DSM 1682 TaxID=991789 RepID=A0A0X8VAH3_ANAPI|nr:YbaN family protein [Anaerotignum propionicum]AMJ40444.1 inner membrane protein YbaN [Anaerotignum propionicum DSM 1682]MEA5057168.1 YbaN family protein [Anaerotignum propionicum]SHE41890.1 hypothetical protein SAMN02745151_00638 [[Clostridium] propionicum DSM 1682] [Anaerotignum propionicum DSM 1682]
MIKLKYIYIGLGFLFFFIGTVGIVIPLLPTTPFLLLASFCFAKGSERFNNWFKSTKIYKNNLESFEKNRSMTLKSKLCILIPVSCMLLFAFFMMNNTYGRGFIVLLILFKYYYFIFKIKTIPTGAMEQKSPSLD